MTWNVTKRVNSNPEWRKTLLETPSGFALFDVSQDALKKADDIWVYFKDVDTAKSALFALGFVKFDDKSIAWDGGTQSSKDLINLIRRFCPDEECLFVQNALIKDIVMEKLDVKCSYDHNVNDEVIWGIKNVLHGFIPEEKYNITREYRLPLSKGLQQCLHDYLIHVSEEMLNVDFISDVGLLRYLDITLEKVPKMLREKFDVHVCKIGERIENDLKYAKVLAKILVPELSPKFDFNKMFPSDLALEVQKADECATQYRNEKLSMSDREIIMGSLKDLLVVSKQRDVPKQRDDIKIRVQMLREKFDVHVCKIGERIEDDLNYALVLAKILVPESSAKLDFNKMFPSDLALEVQKADECATQYRNKKLSMSDREIIMGSLSHLLVVPKQRDDIMIRVKLMEAQLRKTDVKILEDEYEFDISVRKHYSNLKHLTFRRVLLETPSGFAIFGVHERVFARPKLIWADLSNSKEANEVVLALGFVKIDKKSIARSRSDGPGPELSSIIQKLCTESTLIVEDDALKSIIEEKLGVKCFTKCSNDDDGSIGDLMWGLKYFLHFFIPQEMGFVTEKYYEPLSKGLQNALRSYHIVPQGQVDRNLVYILGYLEHLTHASKVVRIIFRKVFNQHVPLIGELIKHDELYAKVIAWILVPEWRHKFNFKSLSGDVAEKVADVDRSLKESGKSVSFLDELAILLVLDFYETLNEKRQGCLQFLNSGCPEEELQRLEDKILSDVENETKLNEWLMLQDATLSDDDLDSVPDQLGDEVQAGVNGTKTRKKVVQRDMKTIGKTESIKKGKCVQGDDFGLSDETESNQQSEHLLTGSSVEVSKVKQLIGYFIEKSVGTNDNLLKRDHPAIFRGAVKVNGHNYPATNGHSKTPDDVPQQQPDSISVTADQAISKGADNVDEQHYLIAENTTDPASNKIKVAQNKDGQINDTEITRWPDQ